MFGGIFLKHLILEAVDSKFVNLQIENIMQLLQNRAQLYMIISYLAELLNDF